jgi:hypothetical protein
VAFAAQIGLLASLAGRLPAAALVLGACAGVLAASLATGWRDLRRVRKLGVRLLGVPALGGALMFFLAPCLVVAHRYSDAPPGTELIFFAAVAWGAVAVGAGAWVLIRGRRRGALSAVVGGLAAVTGAAGILGNWERPSSFSPLGRYATEEMWMLAAGVAFVAGGLLLARASAGPAGRSRSLMIGSASAFVCGAVATTFSPGGLATVARLGEYSSAVVLWATAWSLSVLLATSLLAEGRPIAVGGSLMVAPALLPLLSGIERLVGVAGPQPIVWGGVAGGTLLLGAGLTRLARVASADQAHHAPVWLRWSSLAMAAAALAGLFLPSISAHISAVRPSGAIEMTWTLPGWETVPGWVALTCAMLLVASTLDDAPWAALAALTAPAAYWMLANTPYHVLTPLLSSDIQADLGTEYASITFTALTAWPAFVAVVGAAAGLVVVLSSRITRRLRPSAAPEPTVIKEC